MSRILEQLRLALASNTASPIRQFGTYQIVSAAGEGAQGTVFKAENLIHRTFAIKFYEPAEEGPLQAKSLKRLQEELRTLSSLKHKSIVNVITGGKASFSEKWEITETLDPIESLDPEREVHFYVMDYFPTALHTIFPISKFNFKKGSEPEVASEFAEDASSLFRTMVEDILDAIIFCHNRDIQHKDIKSSNVLYREDDGAFVLADFGYAARQRDSSTPSIHPWSNENTELTRQKRFVENDIWAFCKMANSILPVVRDNLHPDEAVFLDELFVRVIGARADKFPFASADALLTELQSGFIAPEWHFSLGLRNRLAPADGGRFLFKRKIRLPIWRSVFVTDETTRIIDSPEYQRLRGVKQLGPTEFVYPGASHTRFEHSLGVYHLACRYLETLSRNPIFHQSFQPIDHTIKLILLSALLHDIGHYPFSHWIEELGDSLTALNIAIPKHEDRAASIIRNSSIRATVEEHFGIPSEDVIAVIGDQGNSPAQLLAQSIISSILDVDKLDYLVRDSVHCGVDYGHGLDADRLIENLHIHHGRICVTHKARTHVMSLLTCRNLMYQEVYWHKTVRACTGMFKRFFYELAAHDGITSRDLNAGLTGTDSSFLAEMLRLAVTHKLEHLVPLVEPFAYSGRNVYKPVVVYSGKDKDADLNSIRFFQKVLEADFEQLLGLTKKLVEVLQLRIKDIKETDIIIEHTPIKGGNEKYELAQFVIWNDKLKRPESPPDKVKELNEFLENNRLAFVFCSPKQCEKLRQLSSSAWAEVFRDVMAPNPSAAR